MSMANNRRESQRESYLDSEIRTKQSFKDECDINNIMARYKRTGVIDHLAQNPPSYGDFETAEDYQSSLNKVIAAQESFDALPAHVRDRMGNDPGKFLDFMSDPENLDEAIKLGLAQKPKEPIPAPDPDADLPTRAQPPEPDPGIAPRDAQTTPGT